MNIKHLVLATAGSLALTASFASQAQTSLASCLSTPIVNFEGTVVDAAIATPALSTLVDAVVAAGLVDALNDADDITVYAPTNDAFGKIPEDIAGAILADTDVLTAVLTYHVTPGMIDPRRYVTPVRRDTLLGQNVFYSRADSNAMVNNATIDCQGVQTDNGMVWVINSVLIPNF